MTKQNFAHATCGGADITRWKKSQVETGRYSCLMDNAQKKYLSVLGNDSLPILVDSVAQWIKQWSRNAKMRVRIPLETKPNFSLYSAVS